MLQISFEDFSIKTLPDMLLTRALHSGLVAGQWIVICGGQTDTRTNSATNSCEYFDGQNWRYYPEMIHRRTRFELVLADGKIFALGGAWDKDFLNSVEMNYAWSTNSPWVAVSPMRCMYVFVNLFYVMYVFVNLFYVMLCH